MSRKIVLIPWGGVGDVIVSTPALRAFRESHADKKLVVLCRHAVHWQVLRNSPHFDAIKLRKSRLAFKLTLWWEEITGGKRIELHFQHIPLSWVYRKHVTEIVGDLLGVEVKNRQAQLFFTPVEEQRARLALAPHKNVVLMHVHSKCSVNHLWPIENWAALVKSLPDYTFIQLGNAADPKVEGAIDWRTKTTLREAFCLFKFARSFVGIDSVMSHVTTAFNTPGVVLFGDSTPECWGHDNNINIYKHLDCSPCYYLMWGRAGCPYGHPCMQSIGVSEVRDAVIRQMSNPSLVTIA